MVIFYDSVAQLVEQLTLNQWVEGSSPSGVTNQVSQVANLQQFGLFFLEIVCKLSAKFKIT